MSNTKKSLLVIIGLILATTAALAAMGAIKTGGPPNLPGTMANGDGVLTLNGEVVQDKVLKDGDGRVTVSLTLAAGHLPDLDDRPKQAADLVIVLDRSGSMQGRKLNDARQAIVGLLDQLGPDDRLALLTYANGVETRCPLLPMNAANQERLLTAVDRVHAGGGTNLGAGLEQGIDMLMRTPGDDRQRKVILISDGLANQGVTAPQALGRMASTALENRFAISTVGVGLDFNEMVMTAIADQGAGHYYFLEDPQIFARIFETELQATRHVAAADVAIRIPASSGVRLIDAGGYPIRHADGTAVFHPGNLLSGQSRSLYLTFQVPTDIEQEIVMGRIQAHYRHKDALRTVSLPRPLTVACVPDPAAVLASIKKDRWADQVVHAEFSRLKEEVAGDIRSGDKDRARERIVDYASRQAAINQVVGSSKVAENLASDVQFLHDQIDQTFSGPPAAVAEKKKQVAKSLQYEGYKVRRAK